MGFDPIYSLRALWTADIYNIDLSEKVPLVKIPVYFFVGRHDILSSPALIQAYFEQLKAPAGKKLYIFDSSGHEPYLSEPEVFTRLLQRDIINKSGSIQTQLFQ